MVDLTWTTKVYGFKGGRNSFSGTSYFNIAKTIISVCVT